MLMMTGIILFITKTITFIFIKGDGRMKNKIIDNLIALFSLLIDLISFSQSSAYRKILLMRF